MVPSALQSALYVFLFILKEPLWCGDYYCHPFLYRWETKVEVRWRAEGHRAHKDLNLRSWTPEAEALTTPPAPGRLGYMGSPSVLGIWDWKNLSMVKHKLFFHIIVLEDILSQIFWAVKYEHTSLSLRKNSFLYFPGLTNPRNKPRFCCPFFWSNK